ncbi:Asp23/Gls24 family envelope stress response protein [Phaeacidiphilus oryzae]|uniref:hypothetical protein n=1 Tax=Phaeacidiphilus oryzae TaxID=348818 RepID=UPI00056475D3|nr:hypothetical protein [Phaeacidiphilus oryzae]
MLTNRTTLLNRVLLALLGAAALTGGGWLAATGLGGRGVLTLPAWWPGPGPHAALAGRTLLDRLDGRAGDTAAALAVLGVLLVALLWWLAAQRSPVRPRTLRLRHPAGRLRSRALADALAEQTRALPGVAGARVRLSGPRHRLRVRMSVALEPRTDPGPMLRALAAGPLADARTAAGLDRLPATVRFRTDRHRARRAL